MLNSLGVCRYLGICSSDKALWKMVLMFEIGRGGWFEPAMDWTAESLCDSKVRFAVSMKLASGWNLTFFGF